MRISKLQCLSFLLIIFWALACAQPPHYYTKKITSQPAGAKLSLKCGSKVNDKDAAFTYEGVTPWNDSSQNGWNNCIYKAELRGYLPKIFNITGGYREIYENVVLDPFPKVPTPPKAIYPDPESVAVKPLTLDVPDNGFTIGKGTKIATMTFKQHEGSGAGALVADSLILHLQRLGYNVIDREMIESVLKEQNIIAEGKTNLSDLEVSKRIGQLFHADYFVSGAITEYSAQSQNIALSPSVSDEEKEKYIQKYDEYMGIMRVNEIEPTVAPKTMQEWELEYASKPKSSYISIARVGITLKIVDIKTSKIVWVGIAHTSDTRLQEGMKRIVEGMIKSFTKKE
jgi:curli biogenesis system outer membrane secretion channel CsgG